MRDRETIDSELRLVAAMSDAQLALWGSRIAYEVTIDPGPPIHYQVKVDTESPIQDRSSDSSCDRGEDLGILKTDDPLERGNGTLARRSAFAAADVGEHVVGSDPPLDHGTVSA